jgi:hypothetical protein
MKVVEYETPDGTMIDHHTGDNGGNVALQTADPPSIRTGGGSFSIGPLQITPWSSSRVIISEFTFEVLDEESVWPFLDTLSGIPQQPSTGAATLSLPLVAIGAVDDDTDG